MGNKPGRGSTRATGDKRASGQEQAGGSIGRIRETDAIRKPHLAREMAEPHVDPRNDGDDDAKYQEDAATEEK